MRRARPHSARAPRSEPACPGWSLHWSRPESGGRAPAFCSACGSRALSRRRLDGESVTLRHQVALLREIAHRQEDDIVSMSIERDKMCTVLDQLSKPSAEYVASNVVKADLQGRIVTGRAEAERLKKEILVWRHEHEDGQVRPDDDKQRCEARLEPERRQWEAQRRWLEAAILDVRRRGEREKWTPAPCASGELASAYSEAGTLREELDADHRTTAIAWDRVAAARRDIDEERRACGIEERRIELTSELRRSQAAQLRSADEALSHLRSQFQLAQQENVELRASLTGNQEALRCLR